MPFIYYWLLLHRIRQQSNEQRQKKKRRTDEPPSAEERAKYRVEALRAKEKGIQAQHDKYKESAETFELIHECMSSFLRLYSMNTERLTGLNLADEIAGNNAHQQQQQQQQEPTATVTATTSVEVKEEKEETEETEGVKEAEGMRSCLDDLVREYDQRLGICLPEILSYTPVAKSSEQTYAFYDQDSLMHGTPNFHCESVQRLVDLIEMLEGLVLHPSGALAVHRSAAPVKDELLYRVHDEKYIASIRSSLPESPDDGPAV